MDFAHWYSRAADAGGWPPGVAEGLHRLPVANSDVGSGWFDWVVARVSIRPFA